MSTSTTNTRSYRMENTDGRAAVQFDDNVLEAIRSLALWLMNGYDVSIVQAVYLGEDLGWIERTLPIEECLSLATQPQS